MAGKMCLPLQITYRMISASSLASVLILGVRFFFASEEKRLLSTRVTWI